MVDALVREGVEAHVSRTNEYDTGVILVLIDRAARSATVRAVENCEVIMITRSDLMALMKKEQTIAVKLLWSFVQTLTERLRTANTGVVEARKELAIVQATGTEAPFIPASER